MDTPNETQIPMIVSVDDHVVEPADLWQRWLPERFRDRGPRVERLGIESMDFLGGTRYDIVYSDDAPPADCWIYEDLVAPHKRHVAAVGFPREEMSLSPITYDEMRPGCYDVKERVSDMLANHVRHVLDQHLGPPQIAGKRAALLRDAAHRRE